MGLYNSMFDASIDLVHILILYQYDDISTVNCPPNTTSFDPAVHKSLLTSQNCVQRSTSRSSARSQLCQLSLPCLHWLLPSCVQAMPCLCHPPLVQNSTTNQPAPHQHLTSCLQHPIKARTLSQSCRAEQYLRSGILPPHALRERVWARHHAPCQHW